ncbi:MAG: PQQ-binding-like beta-propeller repeat protein [Planctomycetes bacterium]|nr:PQQ-binding-like beta-propeller repeat protein [Planctomycetota bacterium]
MITQITKYVAAGAVVALVGGGVWYLTRGQDSKPGGENRAVAEEPKKDDQAPKGNFTVVSGKSDFTMFGGTPIRNMVNMVDISIPGMFTTEEGSKWKAQLGSRAYGGPTVANGKIFVGTNNENPRNKRDRGKATDDDPNGPPIDKGVLMCFDEKTGEFQWQAIHDKHPAGQVTDWPREGICSTPTVVGDRVYYVTNRCTVVCADIFGFANGNDGFQKEKYQDKTDVDIIWEYDMMKELNVFPHNMSACGPLIVGDTIFVVTANGVDEGHVNIPSPEAPSFIALEKATGKLKWRNKAEDGPGKAIMHGQWFNCSYAVIKDVPQVIFPGGDGWLRAFKPETGELLWSFDANPKDSKYELGGKGTRSDFIGTPVIYNDKIYIGTGQDPEHFEGIGHFWCIDVVGKKGDISPDLVTDATVDPPKTKPNPNTAVVWHYGGEEKRKNAKRDYVFGRTMSSACIVDDICYIGELAGYLHVLDAKTGKKYWQFDLKSAIWGSAYFVDGKVFIGNEDGDLFVFRHDPKPADLDEVEIASKIEDEKEAGKKLLEVRKEVDKKYKIAKIAIDEPIRSTPCVANGVLYIMSEKTLFAIGKK